ncbi:MAG: 4Fe-4S cluster-binding domain-containing protein [Clostridia bacterium]|nr:4Fe-4S cluster-binding domain-containing protein [Clostridia bacterium]
MGICNLCPRECSVDRAAGELGYCGVGNTLRIARFAPHFWEEPPFSGTRGAGAIFFSGCSLRCVYCQNHDLSHAAKGFDVTEDELCGIILDLQEAGVHCIDLVTPTHYADALVRVLSRVKPLLNIPVVWNCGGYEKVETLKALDGLVDVYLPDFKYASEELAERYSGAPSYPKVAQAALAEMYRQTGAVKLDGDGIIKKGVIIRHLVLPGARKDSIAVLDLIANTVPVKDVRLSLMSQYTPDFAADCGLKELYRRVTSFEYNAVLAHAEALGFEGYFQERSSADKKYTPEFSGEDKKRNL